MMQAKEDLLAYWFGRVETTLVPSENRMRIWFGGDAIVDQEIKEKFAALFEQALRGDCEAWKDTARGSLTLIILLDQVSRHLYRDSAKAYAQDQWALELCMAGIEKEQDHELSLIERVFYYMPLMHAENLETQRLSLRAYQILVNLALPEKRSIYEQFFHYAMMHYDEIRKFGRFPQRNSDLSRLSTEQELAFLTSLALVAPKKESEENPNENS